MGRTMRKYWVFTQGLLVALRPRFVDVATLMLPGFTDDDFVNAFRKYCTAYWNELDEYHKYYSQKDKTRKGKPFHFPPP